MADALRTTYVELQIGSKLARSACGTKRSVRAAARWEIAGVASPPAADSAPAPATDFRNALRSIMLHLRSVVASRRCVSLRQIAIHRLTWSSFFRPPKAGPSLLDPS